MQKAWREKILLYIQRSDSLLRCAHDETEKIISCWVKEICELSNGKFHEGKLFFWDVIVKNF